jgi:thiol-disulfide isomerase/thioredoxin
VVPQLRGWHDKYESEGLTIVGVHTPEFFWEKARGKVESAVKQLGVRYPVVLDNGYAIWSRFGIRYWPTTLLVDKKGALRYRRIGEGGYAETEAAIRSLLLE